MHLHIYTPLAASWLFCTNLYALCICLALHTVGTDMANCLNISKFDVLSVCAETRSVDHWFQICKNCCKSLNLCISDWNDKPIASPVE